MQEVPNEISLVINISGCPHHCEGCHSSYLWDYTGSFVSDDLDCLIAKYSKEITCVCFMGGEQNITELHELCDRVHKQGYKTCVYSGSDVLTYSDFQDFSDYIKVGSYKKHLGGLDNPNTNQRFYSVNNGVITDDTSKFRKTY